MANIELLKRLDLRVDFDTLSAKLAAIKDAIDGIEAGSVDLFAGLALPEAEGYDAFVEMAGDLENVLRTSGVESVINDLNDNLDALDGVIEPIRTALRITIVS